jgi:hypothetical protein
MQSLYRVLVVMSVVNGTNKMDLVVWEDDDNEYSIPVVSYALLPLLDM